MNFNSYFEAYTDLFPQSKNAVIEWKSYLNNTYGEDLFLSHYILHIHPKTQSRTTFSIADNFEEKFGAELIMRYDEKELARGRVFENVILP